MRELQILNTEEEARKFIEYWQAREWKANERTGRKVENFKRHVVTWKHNMGIFEGGSNGKQHAASIEAHAGNGPSDGLIYPVCEECGAAYSNKSAHRGTCPGAVREVARKKPI